MNVRDGMDDKIEKAILKSGQKKVHIIYSAYKSDKRETPIDNLDKVAVEGKVILIGQRDEFWGGEKSRNYVSEVLDNPTWLDVAVCANAMIRRVRDEHHVFLEGLTKGNYTYNLKLKEKISKILKPGIKVYEFCMGS